MKLKNLLIYASVVIGIGAAMTGCYKDIIIPEAAANTEGPPQPVSYNAELKPLFNTQCALSGCHAQGAHHPWMESEISYTQIVVGGFVNTTVPKSSILYIMINSDMKEFIPSATDRQKVYDWIRNGAPNN